MILSGGERKKKLHKKVTYFSLYNESTGGKNDPEYLRRVLLGPYPVAPRKNATPMVENTGSVLS